MRNLWEEKLVLLCMTVTAAVGQSVVDPFTPPKLTPAKDQLVLDLEHDPRAELILECEGSQPLVWWYPKGKGAGGPDIEERISITTTTRLLADNVSVWHSKLRLTNVHYLDTGYYECGYANHESAQDVPKRAAIYLFARYL